MTKILDRLPMTGQSEELRFQDRSLPIHPNQLIAWVSVHLAGATSPEPNTPYFPALIDTGSNFGFTLQERHLNDWAGIRPERLRVIGARRLDGRHVPCRAATVWLYANRPGTREPFAGRPPVCLEISKGIAVVPENSVQAEPRLPLLGLSAFAGNELDFWFDSEMRHFYLRRLRWRSSIVRLLYRWL
jgi:hypothetical protein